MQTEVNTIVVGQGIAGTLAAFALYRQNISFMVMDAGHANSASSIAAGMFTPVSGKRNTVNPEIIVQLDFALTIYKQLEELIGKKILHKQHIYQVVNSAQQKNELVEKSKTAAFAEYISISRETQNGINDGTGAVEISHSGWVDCPLLIAGFNDWLKEKDIFLQEKFEYDGLKINEKNLSYKNISFKNIIFCEGYRGNENPFFKEKIIPCKGDMLTIEYGVDAYDNIIKKNSCYIVSIGNKIFKSGSTYHWNNDSIILQEVDKREMALKLDDILSDNYRIIDHQTAIRPTTSNREVIAKQHPMYSSIYMLNGLGTKGVTQGPWWAERLVRLLFNQL